MHENLCVCMHPLWRVLMHSSSHVFMHLTLRFHLDSQLHCHSQHSPFMCSHMPTCGSLRLLPDMSEPLDMSLISLGGIHMPREPGRRSRACPMGSTCILRIFPNWPPYLAGAVKRMLRHHSLWDVLRPMCAYLCTCTYMYQCTCIRMCQCTYMYQCTCICMCQCTCTSMC